VTLRGKNEEKLLAKATSLVKALESAGQEVFGPLKEYPFKLRGKFRYSTVVKYKHTDRRVFQDLIKREIDKLRSSSLQAAIVIK
jgi:primosomal protein N'